MCELMKVIEESFGHLTNERREKIRTIVCSDSCQGSCKPEYVQPKPFFTLSIMQDMEGNTNVRSYSKGYSNTTIIGMLEIQKMELISATKIEQVDKFKEDFDE